MFLSNKTFLATMAALLGASQAVFVCDNYIPSSGGCTGTCTEMHIGMGETLSTPKTECIYNPDSDVGFNLLVCDKDGTCNDMRKISSVVDIEGFFNWHTPGTASITRIGN